MTTAVNTGFHVVMGKKKRVPSLQGTSSPLQSKVSSLLVKKNLTSGYNV